VDTLADSGTVRAMSEPRTDWVETIPEGEEAELIRLAEVLRDIQRKHTRKAGPGRALHRKSHAGVRAEVRVRGDLPAPYRAGIFATSATCATYPAYVRFSNGAPRNQPDKAGDVRGVAIKIVGVPGKKLIPGLEDARTQDFLLIKTPSTPFRSASEFVRIVQAGDNPLLLVPTLARVGFGRTLRLLRALIASIKDPVPSMATLRYWSAAPIRWGDHAARVSLIPAAADPPHAPGLREDLLARLRVGPVTFTLSAQLYVDPQRTPIEAGDADWSETDSPFVPVADVVLPQQDVASEHGRRVEAFVESLSFDPWHAPVEFRPLGNLMRARNHAYRLSVIERAAAPEPDGSESFA